VAAVPVLFSIPQPSALPLRTVSLLQSALAVRVVRVERRHLTEQQVVTQPAAP
jgi:hypothetical protein